MFEYIDDAYFLVGPRGRLPVSEHDEITRRLAMLYEGQCEEALITETARKSGYSRQRAIISSLSFLNRPGPQRSPLPRGDRKATTEGPMK